MRLLASTLIFAGACLVASPATAFWNDGSRCCDCPQQPHATPCESCYDYLETGRKENNLWPQQYLNTDRVNAMAPFDIMVRNGWRKQNLLGSHHFNEDATELTQAGRLRVQWILTQPPAPYRQVFVERAIGDGVTEARIAATEQFAQQVLRGEPATIVDTHIQSDGRPAVVIDYVNTQYRENMMTPVLPQNTGAPATE
ncbi:hypothetical protein [Botrimarina hoheduenensis]|uniref:Uncharacterized protein n=1 Tax=Botrimarina hoheduenensis TaxID=2528000 RepID=A0A5C5WES0_9BACT|nr:hypothetical protein [Botrimarina hoheduenensis]TWT48569.1 hypothetical protein Pla111_03430 [Botrimarina hoheduenensis]